METVLLMPFLYFPEDKTLYIPAVASVIICTVLCYLAFRWIQKKSREQEKATKELEERILAERHAKQPPQH